jgi:molybdopterin-containing oxidoreductase family iron-sulfur binding subunit
VSSINHHVTGLEYWRSLEQLAETPEIAEFVAQEFPGYDVDTIAASSRRGFLKLMSAALALAGVTLSGCRRWPKEELAPYSSNPRGIIPGVPERYASLIEIAGVAAPLLVTSYDGRPIKIEGNPDHPASQTKKRDDGKGYGSADAFAQASVLEMYDPDRSRYVVDRTRGAEDQPHTGWEPFIAVAGPLFSGLKNSGGAGFALLSEATSSPTAIAQRDALLKNFPQAKWYEYEALSRDHEREGARLAFGKPVRTVLHLEKADVVVSLDADFLQDHPNHTRHASDWAHKRRSADVDKTMNRVYVAESAMSVTGSVADVRVGVAPSRLYVLARVMASKLGVGGVPGDDKLNDAESKFVESAVRDLKEAKGNGLLVVGHTAPPAVHAVAHAINAALGAVGNTLTYIEALDPNRPTHIQAIAELTKGIKDKSVATLLIIGGNPVYDAPADLDFAAALASAPTSIHLSLYDNETSRTCKWHLPRAHYLESWGDARAWDGTVTIQQPLIMPLFGGKSPAELLAMINGDSHAAVDKLIRATMSEPGGDADINAVETFEKGYRKTLEHGFVEGSASKAIADLAVKLADLPAPESAVDGFTLCFDGDSHVYDGRFANNGWLQETPDPLSKLMWDNALLIGVKDARGEALNLDLDTGDIVELTIPGISKPFSIPILLLPGQPVGVVRLSLGYGRSAAGPVGNDLGFNAYPIRTAANPWSVAGVKIKKTSDTYRLVASTEHHLLSPMAMDAERYRVGEKNKTGKIIHEATLVEYRENPKDLGFIHRRVALQLFAPPTENNFRDLHAWGMSIDLSACIGCNACALACQAENNIPIVGKAQCYRHREMNWIRIDRYFKGDPEIEDPEVVFQPMTCQHCENAPCEQVCPVAATVHDAEGLNTMVYNRCIGTRYCSNNCPYKVRRFNYFDYHAQDPRFGNEWLKMPWPNIPDMQQRDPALVNPIKRMVFNPEVTVRMRGVMEKCTYCVQRIHGAVTAKRAQGSDIEDGDIITACQQACPTQAIVFGNLMDPEAQVTQLHKNPRVYDVLHEELNTKPRTRYLAKIRNPVEA